MILIDHHCAASHSIRLLPLWALAPIHRTDELTAEDHLTELTPNGHGLPVLLSCELLLYELALLQ